MRPVTLAVLLLAAAAPAQADIALSSNDGHTAMDNGKLVAAKPVQPDTVSVIDLASFPPRIAATVEVPGSVVGPPMAVMVAPDESWGVVTSATKADPAQATGVGPDDRVSVLDLKASPPSIVQSLTSGPGATVVRLSPDGKLALIANRFEGTISVFTVKDRRLTAAGKVDLRNANAGPSGIAFTKDGKAALVSRDSDHVVSELHIDGDKVSLDPRPITTGIKPYTLDINADGTLAAVSNMGRGDGDLDTVSLIDLRTAPFHVVEVVGVASSPEGLKFSPDGRFLAVGSQNGTTKPPGDPFHHDAGTLVIFAVSGEPGHALHEVATAPIGHWTQGIAFSRDGHAVLVQAMTEKRIEVFRWDGEHLTPGTPLPMPSGPGAIQTPWR
jgi:DNA-binding beta-propeller fold protein YncE